LNTKSSAHKESSLITQPFKWFLTPRFDKGPSIQDVRTKEGLSSAEILLTKREGVLQMRTFALFGEKNSDFSKFMVCPHRQRGQFFAILSGRPLWTVPKFFFG